MRYLILISSMIFVFCATALAGWESPVVISSGTGNWYHPQVAVEGSYVHVVWNDDAVSLLKYRRSTDCGVTWDTIMTLAGGTVQSPRVVAQGQSVHVVWRGHEGEVGTILYRRSTDGGASFGSQVTLGTGDDRGYEPDVANSGSNVYVTWIKHDPGYDILYRRSTDNGTNWSSVNNLTNNGGTVEEEYPRIAASSNYVYLVWIEEDYPNVYAKYARGTSGGGWGSISTLWNLASGTFYILSIAAQESYVFVDRDEDAPQGPAQKKSTNYGVGFGGTTYLGSGVDKRPEVDASSAYTSNGCNVYIRDNALYVSTGPGTETQIGTAGGNEPSADIGANWNSDMHVVCSSREPPYRIYYYRYWLYIRGDVNGDGVIDSGDIIYLINYLYSSTSAPNPLWVGDANSDGIVDSGDVIYLINYLYTGTSAPACG